MHTLIRLLTAQPFFYNEGYREVLPCETLAPYIRCFWGSTGPRLDQISDHSSLVVPDACMDLIFTANYTMNTFHASFCGINDQPFYTLPKVSNHILSTFAIRFYPWAAACFATDSMCEVKNQFLSGDSFFKPVVSPIIRRMEEGWGLYALIDLAQQLLLANFHTLSNESRFFCTVHTLLAQTGKISIPTLASEQGISTRQLERIFLQNAGIAPKALHTLFRYQKVLEEALFSPVMNIQETVYKYGYTDQSHLLREFKRFHTMTPAESRIFALQHR